jgi:hypothetical protein
VRGFYKRWSSPQLSQRKAAFIPIWSGRNNEGKTKGAIMSKLHILQHSLGLNEYGQGNQYRNHFVTGEGSKDYPACKELVAEGLMTERAGSAISGGDSIFHVTAEGIDYVSINSPKPPKLTQSQQRYMDYLHADTSASFAEWLGIRRKA